MNDLRTHVFIGGGIRIVEQFGHPFEDSRGSFLQTGHVLLPCQLLIGALQESREVFDIFACVALPLKLRIYGFEFRFQIDDGFLTPFDIFRNGVEVQNDLLLLQGVLFHLLDLLQRRHRAAQSLLQTGSAANVFGTSITSKCGFRFSGPTVTYLPRMKRLTNSFLAAFSLTCFSVTAAETNSAPLPRFPAVEPAQAEKTFQCRDGFQMQLIASEPLVTDPVAMTYDENGLGYVVEMNDYPYTDKKTHQAWKENTTDKAIGKVRLLEDTDGDGKFDKSYIFAEDLSWPSGIVCWKGGVFVTATPDIWYLKDTDGDHKADVRKKVFTGFRKYNVQAVMNNPIWGLDNKIYIAGSSNGGKVVPGDKAEAQPVTISHNDFRIDPVTEKFELISGGARFGNSFDDFGNHFLCNIRNPCQHVVFESRYFARNPYCPVPNPVFDARESGDSLPVFRISPIEPWRELRAKMWTAENKKTPKSELVAGGVFTSSSGITVYRGAAYPEKYRGNAFVCEVANNLIQRQTLVTNGVTFKAEVADTNAEFIASTDTWFRPVNFVNAPDGTLHVLDMYRENIEHPWSIPDDIHAKVDLESGRDRGRIYRLAPPGFHPTKQPQLGKATTAELVAALENPNSWWRETAQRLIFERQDKAAVEPLKELVAKTKSVVARLHALYALDGLGALTDKEILAGLNNDSAGVRENAVKLAEPRLRSSAALLDKVLALAKDRSARVRMQVSFAIGDSTDRRTSEALYDIVRQDPEDSWIRAAVCSATPELCVSVLSRIFKDEDFVRSKGGNATVRQLAFIIGAQNKLSNLYAILNQYMIIHFCYCHVEEPFLCGFGDGLKQAGKNFRTAFTNSESFGAIKVEAYLSDAKERLKEPQFLDRHLLPVKLLAYENFDAAKDLLKNELNADRPQEVQIQAVRSLSGFKETQVASILLEPWRTYTPPVREEVLGALFARKDRLKPLLDAIDAGVVAPNQISGTRKTQLLSHADSLIRQHAEKLFGQNAAGTRKEVVEKYRAALALKGDKERGRKVFESNCMTCHRAGNLGNEVGPNLETVRDWDAEKMLLNILDPNREVAPNYVSYDIELKDGASVAGLVATETAGGITLKKQGGTEETILRQNIAKMASSGLSLMPEGLEANIQPQDMADLISFLQARN